MEEIEEDPNKWKDKSACLKLKEYFLNPYYLQGSRFSAIPIKILVSFSTEIEQKNSTLWRNSNTPNNPNNLRKNNKARCVTIYRLKLYYKAIESNICTHIKNRYTDEQRLQK